ncbi:glycine cleavage system aminomethyltransferase GcvT [Salibaculum halophilum]|uniref:glycine cleavage system aminomethyltransferase GcvT n=1 Tax=Salibaculum halophilum TaxID=1914408 RepID=UPI000A10820E|nr:glycine cleavage system aminomethyltransferase GcvT [Salibaculum halophilum]
MADLKKTPLYDLHAEFGAKFVPFAGYEMPVQYAAGVMKEHLWTRESAGLFDVSHMGQVILHGPQAAAEVEALVPQALQTLKPGRQRYAFFTNDAGGILDDLMIANRGDDLFAVVNAACKTADIAHMRAGLPTTQVQEITDRALLALQGPRAEAALARLVPDVVEMRFMDIQTHASDFGALWISRSGYTGEDGFEISVPADSAAALARALLADDAVAPVGLGARDSLRLEAGLCLYGADLDETTTPVEANLTWAIQKARRETGDYPGFARIRHHLVDGPARLRVGLRPEGRAPMRAGTPLFADEDATTPVGAVTSGAHGPSIGAAISMGYVGTAHASLGTPLWGEVRGKRLPVTVCDLPFRPSSYKT